MPTTVTAQEGDCLCSIAHRHGFNNCQPLRNVAENRERGCCDRPLRAGEDVIVPDLEEREESGEETEATHEHEARNVPPASIRFVHGSPSTPYRDDATLEHLEISTFPSDKGGNAGTADFPTEFGYHINGHVDPDTFKIEVVDPQAESDAVTVTLEALRIRYADDGTVEQDEDGNPLYEPFDGGDPEAELRDITVACEKVSQRNDVRFRSRYLRLVTDDQDFAALSGDPQRTDGSAQGLLVTDMADGGNGIADKVEILDQHIRAEYELVNCPAGDAEAKCFVSADVPVGEDRQRIRLCIHVFRTTVGGAPGGAISEADVRRRTMRWFRRIFAQINMAPKFVPCDEGGPEVQFLDPPADNMITISQDHGRPVTGTGGPYTLRFRLDLRPVDIVRAEADAEAAGGDAADARPTVTVNLTNGWTPEQVGQAIAGALPAGFTGRVIVNPRAFTAVNGSCDILITRADGRRVMVDVQLLTPGAGITVFVSHVDMLNVRTDVPDSYIPLTPEMRRIVHEAPGTDDRLDVYVCQSFSTVAGFGLNPHSDIDAPFQPNAPLRWAFFVDAPRMDGTDNHPDVYPHEAGHVMFDAIHVRGGDALEGISLMNENWTPPTHNVGDAKRITDTPLLVSYGFWNPVQTTPGAFMFSPINCAARFRDRSGSVTEGW